MDRLRLHPDSNDILDQWWFSNDASPPDRALVSRLLTEIESGGLRATQFHWETNLVNRRWTNVSPREGLVVVVELFTDEPESFRIVSIATLTRNPDA